MSNVNINKRGFWEDPISKHSRHVHDHTLNTEIIKLLKDLNVTSILDLGCGPGLYSKNFIENGFDCKCYDGNPYTEEDTNGRCQVLDLATLVELNRKFDCVLSLEVGEHIPNQYEDIFIQNITNHCSNIIILSWAIPGQSGDGHVNCQRNDYIEVLLKNKNFLRNLELEKSLRKSAKRRWFKNTLMVFEKNTNE